MKKSKIREITVISVFTALLVLCSWLSVPNTVPFTMQAFGVFLAATLLGKKKGTIVIVVYLGLGALGIPVFAGGKAGISALLGQTGGYISGFLPCAFVCGAILEKTKKSPAAMVLSMTAGLLCVYICGSLWFSTMYIPKGGESGFWIAVSTCVFPFVIADLLKIALATFVAGRVFRTIDF